MNVPLVSIVVTTKNEELNIGNCLKSIQNQTYPNIELIVIDNYSSDGTCAIAKLYTPYVFQIGPERSAQRNYGLLKKSKGDFGMFVDADMLLSSTLVSDCVTKMQTSTKITGIYIPEVILGNRLFHSMRRFERPFYSGTPIDCVRFFSLEEVRNIGGFDEITFTNGSGEDWDFDRRLRQAGQSQLMNKRFVVEDKLNFIRTVQDVFRYSGTTSCIFHNEQEMDFYKTLKKKIYYSSAFSRYKDKWGKHDTEIGIQFSPINRLFGLFLEPEVIIRTIRNLHLYVLFLLYKFSIALGIFLFTLITKIVSKKPMDISN